MGLSPWSTGTLRALVQVGAVLVALATLVSVGCSGRTDRPDPEDEEAGGTSGVGQGGDSSGGSSASAGGGNATGEACDESDAESCSAEGDRCCAGPSGATCVPITWRNCTGCNQACNLLVSNSCVDETCVCGDEPACSGAAPFCVRGVCVECLGNADCVDVKGPNAKCFEGTCVDCDPADPWACSATHQACSEERECVPCSPDQGCPGSLFCEFDSGLCKPCVEHSQCSEAFKPICAVYTAELSECRHCATDDECAERDPEMGQCMPGSGECFACDPEDDAGCEANEECLRRPDSDGYECRGCENDGECTNDWGTPLCDLETHTCVPCTDPSIDDPDERCGAVCVTTGTYEGECASCDPGTNVGCSPPTPFCDVGFTCRECLGTSVCPAGFECSANQECVGCTSDADCAGNPSGGQCIEVEGGKACRFCDPVDHAGCPPSETCYPGGTSCDGL